MKRNTLKGWIPTTGMILVLAVGAFANGGIIVPNSPTVDSCTDVSKNGIIVPNRSLIEVIADTIAKFFVSDEKAAASCTEKNGIIVPN